MMQNTWFGKKVLVIGAARQGEAATRFLAKQGALVTLNDHRPANNFSKLMKNLQSIGVYTVFGHHPVDLVNNMDAICISGGIPLDLPIISKARELNIPLTNDTQIFMEAVNAHVVGITGSAGKTTTTIMIGEIAKKACNLTNTVWVGGNIGFPMIDHIHEIQKDDWVVLELSSFQLELMSIAPEIAVILNITPNHLDRHKSMEAYIKAKQRILDFQDRRDISILNSDNEITRKLLKKAKGELITFGIQDNFESCKHVFIKKNYIYVKNNGKENPLIPVDSLKLPGHHNIYNMLAACAASYAAGFSSQAMQQGVSFIEGIPHRLQFIKEINGVRWINDSIATTPERVAAALEAIAPPLILLLGGRDKNLPWDDLSQKIEQKNPQVILFGEAQELIHDKLLKIQKKNPEFVLLKADKLEKAIRMAHTVSSPGDTVLLSPGCTSFDSYKDFEERGEQFAKLVKELS